MELSNQQLRAEPHLTPAPIIRRGQFCVVRIALRFSADAEAKVTAVVVDRDGERFDEPFNQHYPGHRKKPLLVTLLVIGVANGQGRLPGGES